MDQNKELKKAGLKVTLPRLKILQILQEPENQHISAEDVYKILIEQGEEIEVEDEIFSFEDPFVPLIGKLPRLRRYAARARGRAVAP